MMTVRICCANENCGTEFLIPENLLGKVVRCRKCGENFSTVDGSLDSSSTPEKREPVAVKGSVSKFGAGARIGRFLIRTQLGSGAFGTVFRAFDPQLDRELALKIPNASVLDTPKRVERFLREAKAAANLRHPHIVPVFDAGRDGGHLYIASAFVDGKPLSDAIKERGLAFPVAARIVRDLAEALSYAHQMGVIHRDVKPANMMLDKKGNIHLMDFGLAVRQEESRLTNDGAILGTPSYMAPEQAIGQQGAAQPAIDQYAAGVVLYELLTGHVPFEGPPAIVIHNVIHTEPEAPHLRRPKVPKDLETVCLKAMSKQAADRYGDCEDLAADLRRFLDGDPIRARRMSAWEQCTRLIAKNRVVASLAGVIALLLVLVTVGSTFFGISSRQIAAQLEIESKSAQEERRKAEANAATAREARKNAEANATLAAKNEALAQERYKDLLKEQHRVRQQSYTADIRLAQASWEESRVPRMLDLLKRQFPKAKEPDLRGIEWRLLRRFPTIDNSVIARGNHQMEPAISPDDRWLALPSAPGSPRGVTLHRLEAPKDNAAGEAKPIVLSSGNETIVAVQFHPKTGVLVGMTASGKLLQWNKVGEADDAREDPVVRLTMPQPAPGASWDTAFQLAFHPSGSSLAIASRDGLVQIVAADDMRVRFERNDIGRPVWGVAFDQAGSKLLTSSDAGIRLFDIAKNELVWKIDPLDLNRAGSEHFRNAIFLSDDERIAAGTFTGRLSIWSKSSGKLVRVLHAHNDEIRKIALADQGKTIVTSALDGTLRLWSSDSLESSPLMRGHLESVWRVVGARNRPLAVAVDHRDEARIWDLAAGQRVRTLQGTKRQIKHLASAENGTLAGVDEDRILCLWNDKTGERTARWEMRENITGLAITRDGATVLAATPTKVLFLDREGAVRREAPHDSAGVALVCIDPAERRFAVSRNNGSVAIFSMTNPAMPPTILAGDAASIDAVEFSPNGKLLLVSDHLRGVAVWDLETGGRRFAVPCPTFSASFSPLGNAFVVAGWGGYLAVFDAGNGALVREFKGHTGHVWRARFSGEGSRLLSVSGDQSTIIWSIETGQELLTLRENKTSVHDVVLLKNTDRFVSSDANGKCGIWDATPVPEAAGDLPKKRVE
jgi:eukaryotic-like serine/threonine-protein kinase